MVRYCQPEGIEIYLSAGQNERRVIIKNASSYHGTEKNNTQPV